jgi:hypothetical protein
MSEGGDDEWSEEDYPPKTEALPDSVWRSRMLEAIAQFKDNPRKLDVNDADFELLTKKLADPKDVYPACMAAMDLSDPDQQWWVLYRDMICQSGEFYGDQSLMSAKRVRELATLCRETMLTRPNQVIFKALACVRASLIEGAGLYVGGRGTRSLGRPVEFVAGFYGDTDEDIGDEPDAYIELRSFSNENRRFRALRDERQDRAYSIASRQKAAKRAREEAEAEEPKKQKTDAADE